ncbi:glycosyltransferase family 4 protein [Patescibacteria group bacterium]|nr:glycosyltransferase family 4 protein [Patescibacteria group bacterium]
MAKFIILFHGRYPSEKAAATYVTQNAESLVQLGHAVTILSPARRTLNKGNLNLAPEGCRIIYMPIIDLFELPILRSAAFWVSLTCFTLSSWLYLKFKSSGKDNIISNDLLVGLMVNTVSSRLIYEVHDFPERWHFLYRQLFKRAMLVIATNSWKEEMLTASFSEVHGKVLMERNGVNLEKFYPGDKTVDRTVLGLSTTAPVVVYTGHLYGWKGVATLMGAAKSLPNIDFYLVGGTKEDIEKYKAEYSSSNMHFVGHVPHADVRRWQSSADMLVLPNTGKDKLSSLYTSPMKLFEYMANKRPIIASDIPSIREVVGDNMATLFEPDNSLELASAIRQVIENPKEANKMADIAYESVLKHSWRSRAMRMCARVNAL